MMLEILIWFENNVSLALLLCWQLQFKYWQHFVDVDVRCVSAGTLRRCKDTMKMIELRLLFLTPTNVHVVDAAAAAAAAGAAALASASSVIVIKSNASLFQTLIQIQRVVQSGKPSRHTHHSRKKNKTIVRPLFWKKKSNRKKIEKKTKPPVNIKRIPQRNNTKHRSQQQQLLRKKKRKCFKTPICVAKKKNKTKKIFKCWNQTTKPQKPKKDYNKYLHSTHIHSHTYTCIDVCV